VVSDTDGLANDRPTLKTIANLAGLSVASVSRALKDASDIGEDTKIRVRDIALQIGYRPNRAGVRLRTGRTNVIALVMSAESDVMNHTAKLIHSVASGLRDTGYHMIVVPYFSEEDPLNPIRYIYQTGSADGVIINMIEPNDARVAFMTEHGMPFATHGRSNMGIEHPYFDYDNETYSRLMVRALAARGRTNLALLSPPTAQSYGLHMVQGFLDETRTLGLTGRVVDGITSDTPSQKIQAVMTSLFAGTDRPDGVIVGSTTSAMCTVAGAEAAGLTLSKDFDVAAKEAIPILSLFRQGLIIASEDVGRAGDFLVGAVLAAVENRHGPAQQALDVPQLD
jgi:LacI family transcriptional regulator